MNSITKGVAAAGDLRAVGSVEDLAPETIEQVAVLAAVALVVVDRLAAAVEEVAAEDLEVVAMEASTTAMDMEETTTPRGLTGGATESACSRYLPNKLIWKPHVT